VASGELPWSKQRELILIKVARVDFSRFGSSIALLDHSGI